MINEFYVKLAKLAINYSVRVKKGDRVFIAGPAFTKELLQALFVETIKAGGHPLLLPMIEGIQELRFKYATDDQLVYVDEIQKQIYKEFDSVIQISGDYNTRKLSLVDSKKIITARGSPGAKEVFGILMDRMAKQNIGYLILPFPCNSLAQEANMDLFSYTDFVGTALGLDEDEPVNKWLEKEKEQEILCKYLNEVDKITVIGDDTNLEFSVKGRIWLNECGRMNLPDGEICTAPIEDSAEGHIRFTYPGIYQGRKIENVYIEFKNGKVTSGTAEKGNDLLQEILKVENANILGEFAIGTNYGITKYTKNILFDEKLGGTLHCALGLSLSEAGGKNVSSIHWDIVKDMKTPNSKILADGKVIYEEGKWKI